MEGEKAAGPCKWQSASAGSGPQEGDMLSVVCSSVVVFLFVCLFRKVFSWMQEMCRERASLALQTGTRARSPERGAQP